MNEIAATIGERLAFGVILVVGALAVGGVFRQRWFVRALKRLLPPQGFKRTYRKLIEQRIKAERQVVLWSVPLAFTLPLVTDRAEHKVVVGVVFVAAFGLLGVGPRGPMFERWFQGRRRPLGAASSEQHWRRGSRHAPGVRSECLRRLSTGQSVRAVSRGMNVPESTLRTWRRIGRPPP